MANETQVDDTTIQRPVSATASSTQSAALKWYKVKGADDKWYKTQAGSPEDAKAKIFKNLPKVAPKTVSQTPTTSQQPVQRSSSDYVKEALGGIGTGIKGIVTYPFEAAKLREGEEKGTTGDEILTPTRKNIGPTGRFLLHSGEDFMGALQKGYEARQRSKQSGEGVAGQILSTLEQYPIIGGAIQHMEKGGPNFSPETLGGLTELGTYMIAPKVAKNAVDRITGMVKPEVLRAHAGELDSRALKVAKGQSTDTGLQVAQEGIWGALKELPNRIENARKAKYAQIEQLAKAADAVGKTIDIEKGIDPIVQEWKKVANARGNLSMQTIKRVDSFLNQFTHEVKPDPITGKPKAVPRNLTSASISGAVELTRHDGLLARLSEFTKEHPEQLSNLARRINLMVHDEISKVEPEIGKLRAEQGRLIEARDAAIKNYENFLNEKTTNLRSMFRLGGGAIGMYLGAKLMGVPYAEAFAVPVLLWNSMRATPVRTLKAVVYSRIADMIDGGVRGTYKPPTRQRTPPPASGAPPTPTPTTPRGGPTSPAQPASAPPTLSASFRTNAPVSGVPTAVTGQVLAGPPNIPNAATLRLGGAGAETSVPTPPEGFQGLHEDGTLQAEYRGEGPGGAHAFDITSPPYTYERAVEALEAPEGGSLGTITKGRKLTTSEKAELKNVTSWKEFEDLESKWFKEEKAAKTTPSKKSTEGGAVSARTRQNLMNEVDTQVGRLDSSNAGVAKRARSTLDQIKTLLDDKKVAGLTEEERTQLIKRADWRARQAKVRASKPAESVAAREPKPDQIEGMKRMSDELASVAGSAEEFAIAKQQAYEALARFEGGKEWSDNLKKAARELEQGAKARGVAYDPNSEFDAVLEAIKLMRESGLEMQ